jgi:hypothetical protein
MTTYIAKVNGIIWQGCKASTEYNFDHNPTKQEIKERSGDFQVVTSARVIARTVTVKQVESYRF